MTFLPIVGRELRVAARRKRTYWSRASAAAMAFVVIGWMLLTTAQWMQPDTISRAIFGTLTMLLFVYALACGAGATADCISSEKREGTLGLLFLTDLKGYDIVLGKLAASALGNFYSLLAALPVLAIPLLLGGVSVDELLRASALLVNTMFFSVAVGMWASVRSHDDRRAMSATVGMIVLITAVLPAVAAIIGGYFSGRSAGSSTMNAVAEALLLPSPGFAMGLHQSMQFGGAKLGLFWGSLATTLALSLAFLAHAAWQLPRVWQDQVKQRTFAHLLGNLIARLVHAVWQLPRVWQKRPAQRPAPPLGDFMDRMTFGNSDQRKRLRDWLLDENPYLWLAARERFKPVVVWAFLANLALLWIAGAIWARDWFFNPATYVMTALTLHTALKYWIATEACRRLNEDRRSGALELVLSTPLTVPQILAGQMRALRRQFARPVVAVLIVDIVLMLAYRENQRYDEEWIATWLVGMVVFVADMWFLAWFGMWQGLKAKSVHAATRTAAGVILVLPWVLFSFGTTLVAAIGRFRFLDNFAAVCGLWLIISLAVGLIAAVRARKNLSSRLRLLAMERYQPAGKTSWWPFGRKRDDAPPIIDS